ncbi:LysR family transcriptional regulator [Cloacibacillus sp. An23]|uniref:LysR family transcriptional regulator n=1 Tax=Cloacibacillus sp. An23 TaxID=1965591 RepID=UPI000B368816|nr:LysR family transcriptional regulator [Cloacibacillus sp. An23]OUO93499.1 hypothetical protein B5F39_07315 [Cloacibacillus sp. An23]
MIREMEYILAIYKEKSFSQAAKTLHVSQPALSGMVKKVENNLGAPIFDRSTTPITLTHAGEYYVGCAEKILRIKYEMEDYFKNLRTQSMTVVNIGAASFFCVYILPEFIKEFRQRCPGCQINILELNATDTSEHLLKDTADFVIDVRKELPDDIASFTLYQEHILLAVPSQFSVNAKLGNYRMGFEDVRRGAHIDGSMRAVDMRLFRDEPFILLRKGHDMTRRALEICGEAGFTPNVVAEFDQMLSSFRMVLNGGGVAFVRDGVARHVAPTDGVVFYKIDDRFASRDLLLNYRKDREFSPLAMDFVKFLTSPDRCWA